MADQDAGPQEFPKLLYKNGEVQDELTKRPVHHSLTCLVNDQQEESEARANGFLPAGGDPEPLDSGSEDDFNGADPGAFDHDGDGRPGGAPKGGNRKKVVAV